MSGDHIDLKLESLEAKIKSKTTNAAKPQGAEPPPSVRARDCTNCRPKKSAGSTNRGPHLEMKYAMKINKSGKIMRNKCKVMLAL
ncbi:hypothetical protein TSUD_312160 [Trifolium subterraneum]|uniref:Uncharacterized protein n=1 Tax=Trifolium subterraneum TaxID=3900 RepID=A0A2Z6LZ57_TRISU|nr:hypothetical protein TSUD_312160 [Trifolium subterraneum]